MIHISKSDTRPRCPLHPAHSTGFAPGREEKHGGMHAQSGPAAPLRRSPRFRGRASPQHYLLDLQPELLEIVCVSLSYNDITALASTATSAASLHSIRISARIAVLRQTTECARGVLAVLIHELPDCLARQQVLAVMENVMDAFAQVSVCNEYFVLLSRAVAARASAGRVPARAPLEAARLSRDCCKTCDAVTEGLTSVRGWLDDLVRLTNSTPARRASMIALSDDDDEISDDPSANDGTGVPVDDGTGVLESH